MNAAIELHDSDLNAIVWVGASVVLTFAPAYLHRSEGRPGWDASSGWLQTVTLTFADAVVSVLVELPCTISDGSLRIGDILHDNLIPAGGEFEMPCEMRVVSQKSEVFTVRGNRLVIRLDDEPRYLQEFFA